MQLKVTLRDVAARAGVHPATVSRALSDQTRRQVNADTARRVVEAAEALGYEPDLTARTLRTGRTATAGVMIPDLTNPLFPPIVRGIEDCLAERGFTALIANTDNDAQRERRVLRAMRARNVDGFILMTTHRKDETLASLVREEIPVVTVNRMAPGADVSSVTADDDAGVNALVDHLVGLGHSRISTIAGPRTLSTGRARLRAFTTGLRRHGLEPRQVVYARTFSEAEGSRCMDELLADTDATAVVAGNDMLAVGALDALRVRGLRCPDDISVTGFNDMRFMDKLNPPLTTVRIPQVDMGTEAARILLDRLLARTTATQHAVLPVTLITRESTAAPRA
ncbi:LacI family DNA-binding transcriptional regulator [Pseudonocardia sp.]|uniref:LacI family DNA-binding transcriptional regulator n=1 Tax=Pseudonocardia sp. TaxID=60912 RepID=UPI0031FC3FF6